VTFTAGPENSFLRSRQLRREEAKDFLAQYQKKRPAVKIIRDHEKVAPTIIKEVLIEGLVKAGMPNE
jgi:hypothetical protein